MLMSPLIGCLDVMRTVRTPPEHCHLRFDAVFTLKYNKGCNEYLIIDTER